MFIRRRVSYLVTQNGYVSRVLGLDFSYRINYNYLADINFLKFLLLHFMKNNWFKFVHLISVEDNGIQNGHEKHRVLDFSSSLTGTQS